MLRAVNDPRGSAASRVQRIRPSGVCGAHGGPLLCRHLSSPRTALQAAGEERDPALHAWRRFSHGQLRSKTKTDGVGWQAGEAGELRIRTEPQMAEVAVEF